MFFFFLMKGGCERAAQLEEASVHEGDPQRLGELVREREPPGLLPPDPRPGPQLPQGQEQAVRAG